jgi:ABC-type transport system involved in cytochrome c biogenesis ATPase subunit
MLKRIQIQNFRSCQDVLLEDLGYLTALVGRNGSGKTNILRAIDWLARAATATDLSRQDHLREFSSPSMTADIELSGGLYRYSLSFSAAGDAGKKPSGIPLALNESVAEQSANRRWTDLLRRVGRNVHVRGRESPIQLGEMAPCLPGLTSLLPDELLLEPQRPLLAFFASTRYYPLDETNVAANPEGLPLVSASGYQNWIDRFQMVSGSAYQNWAYQFPLGESRDDAVLLRLLHAYFRQRPVFDEVRSLLGPKGLDLIDDITVNEIRYETREGPRRPRGDGPDFYLVSFQPGAALGKGPRPLTYGELSLGTRRIVRAVTSLLVDQSALMLLEHPEDGIHPGLLRKLIGLLQANVNPAQIILSSHSTQVLNALTPQDVRLVYMHRGATRVRGLTTREVAAADRFIEHEGTMADFIETVEE